ncbi:Kinase D-interacting substrate [Beauveria bassiana]|uniref:Kinase D-interacting substrate n=1 Tax=Beauveria bassiana TaxID=176275 RepID=A0A2N6NNK1_BEABA|nr:Kinase D-interacting substrate [Beauveria bassiana]
MGKLKIKCVDSGRKSLNRLPNHLLVEIGSRLLRGDLRALVMTNKRFHAVFEEILYEKDTSVFGIAKSLFWAARRSDFVVANKIIKFGGDLDSGFGRQQESKQRMTALVLSMIHGHRAMATMLVAAGANVDVAPSTSKIPVFLALKKNWLDVLKLMVAVGKPNLAVIDEVGHGLLTAAAHLNHLEAVQYLLSVASHLRLNGSEKATAFHGAILHNSFAMLSLLLKSPHTSPNAPCEQSCEQGKTPLQLACEQGKIDFVRALLGDARVSPQLPDAKSNDCLVLKALQAQKFDLVMLLLTHENCCKPAAVVFTEACKLKRELIAGMALELLDPSEQQASEWRKLAQEHGLCDLVNMLTQMFEL